MQLFRDLIDLMNSTWVEWGDLRLDRLLFSQQTTARQVLIALIGLSAVFMIVRSFGNRNPGHSRMALPALVKSSGLVVERHAFGCAEQRALVTGDLEELLQPRLVVGAVDHEECGVAELLCGLIGGLKFPRQGVGGKEGLHSHGSAGDLADDVGQHGIGSHDQRLG